MLTLQALCIASFDQGNKKRGQIKYCGGTTNLLPLLRIGRKQFAFVLLISVTLENYFANLR